MNTTNVTISWSAASSALTAVSNADTAALTAISAKPASPCTISLKNVAAAATASHTTPAVHSPPTEADHSPGVEADHPTAGRENKGNPVGVWGGIAQGTSGSPGIHANSMLTVMYAPPGLQDLGCAGQP